MKQLDNRRQRKKARGLYDFMSKDVFVPLQNKQEARLINAISQTEHFELLNMQLLQWFWKLGVWDTDCHNLSVVNTTRFWNPKREWIGEGPEIQLPVPKWRWIEEKNEDT